MLSLLAVSLAVYWLINWQKRANTPELNMVVIGKFFFICTGYLGTFLFAVLYWTSVYWTFLYKVIIGADNY